jgi:hypothetical protein
LLLVDIGFEIRDGAAVGAQEVGPGVPVENGADAFIVPDVGAWGYEKGLAWLLHCCQFSGFGGERCKGRRVGLTAMDMRQMEHSEEFTDAVSESRVEASFLGF